MQAELGGLRPRQRMGGCISPTGAWCTPLQQGSPGPRAPLALTTRQHNFRQDKHLYLAVTHTTPPTQTVTQAPAPQTHPSRGTRPRRTEHSHPTHRVLELLVVLPRVGSHPPLLLCNTARPVSAAPQTSPPRPKPPLRAPDFLSGPQTSPPHPRLPLCTPDPQPCSSATPGPQTPPAPPRPPAQTPQFLQP